MRTKKYVIALAIFGGMLFTAYAASTVEQNEQEIAKIKKGPIKIPSAG